MLRGGFFVQKIGGLKTPRMVSSSSFMGRRYGPVQWQRSSFNSLPQRTFATDDQSAQKQPLQFTRAEVAEHHNLDDCWIIIDNKVYNVTEWMVRHPGGIAVARNPGGDATNDFVQQAHSRFAKELMSQFYIGDLVDSEKTRYRHFDKPHLLADIDTRYEWPSQEIKETKRK